jgi:hypothetical protein
VTAEARATFGGRPPPGANVEPRPGPSVPADAAVPVLAATLTGAVVVFGGVALFARRRSRPA